MEYSSLPKIIDQDIINGTKLVGDDFNQEKLEIWFKQEQEAYYQSDLKNDGDTDPWYDYMRYTNEKIGFKYLKNPRTILVLGPGSGKEVEYIEQMYPNCKINFLEASENFKIHLKQKFVNSKIIEPKYSGHINLSDNSQSVVFAFSVLHHIPNVSFVLKEVSRVLEPGGILLIREPCSSMGDWRYPRSATPNERGMSKKYMLQIFNEHNLELICKPTPILFEPINKILKKYFNRLLYNVKYIYFFDKLISKVLSINDYYWRDNFFKKLGPSSYFYVVKKKHDN